MKPVQFLSKVEPIVISMFNAMAQTDMQSCSIRELFEPQKRHYEYIFNYRQLVEEYDGETQNYYFGKLAEAHQELLLINTASSSAAGSILQVAQQCISMAWNKNELRLNKGKEIGSQKLSNIVWHGRNQALHFEEGVPTNPETRKCIEALSKEFELNIESLAKHPRSLAREILTILGWDSYQRFAEDMVNMLNENP